ncbi:hypothetical protein T484DRAFT_1830334 [Baffinella frigidus]|nr:hypothetical protein T484DRAFT_1830334 [Cryptophyta sp. CCMP2293]
MGEMRWDYALLFFVVGGISSLFGQVRTPRLVNARVTGHADAEARRSVVTALPVMKVEHMGHCFVLGWAVAKYKKQYLITALLTVVIRASTVFMGLSGALITVVIGASTVFMGLSGAARTYQKYSHGQHLGAHSKGDD